MGWPAGGRSGGVKPPAEQQHSGFEGATPAGPQAGGAVKKPAADPASTGPRAAARTPSPSWPGTAGIHRSARPQRRRRRLPDFGGGGPSGSRTNSAPGPRGPSFAFPRPRTQPAAIGTPDHQRNVRQSRCPTSRHSIFRACQRQRCCFSPGFDVGRMDEKRTAPSRPGAASLAGALGAAAVTERTFRPRIRARDGVSRQRWLAQARLMYRLARGHRGRGRERFARRILQSICPTHRRSSRGLPLAGGDPRRGRAVRTRSQSSGVSAPRSARRPARRRPDQCADMRAPA